MSGRFDTIVKSDALIYCDNCDVVIEAHALLKDNADGRILAQLKLRSLDDKTIIACRVNITSFEPNGSRLPDDASYLYLDLSVGNGTAFGSDKPIYLSYNTARSISPKITEITYADGSVWHDEGYEWHHSPPQQPISDILSPNETSQYLKNIGSGDALYVPVVQNGYFQCTCGAVNLSTASLCCNCRRNVNDVISRFNKDELDEQFIQQKQAEHKQRAETKLKIQKATILICTITILAIITGNIVKSLSDKAHRYDLAVEYMNNGDYVNAISLFESLGSYKDSVDMVEQVQQRILDDFKDHADKGDFAGAFDMSREYTLKSFDELMVTAGYEKVLQRFKDDFLSYAGEYECYDAENGSNRDSYMKIECNDDWTFDIKRDEYYIYSGTYKFDFNAIYDLDEFNHYDFYYYEPSTHTFYKSITDTAYDPPFTVSYYYKKK